VLYTGLADARGKLHRDGHLGHRVHEYYATRIGAKSPHAGGWPVKILSCLSELWIHYAYCGDVHQERPASVIHRKLSLGTQSDHGERFAERALSAAVTCRMQHRSLFTYLSELIAAHNRGDPFPALAG
jgi:hypothetical protein